MASFSNRPRDPQRNTTANITSEDGNGFWYGGQEVTGTSTTSAPPWMIPYMQDYMGRVQDVANRPYVQSPTQYTDPNDYLTAGWNATANRATQGSPVMDAANSTLQNTISGGYLSQNNPYLTNQINAAQGDLTRAWNTVEKPAWDKAMQNSGSFGNTGVMEANDLAQSELQKNLGRIGSDMRFNAYNTERGYQNQALGLAPTFANQDYVDANALTNVGREAQTFNDRNAAQNYNWWRESQNYPTVGLDLMGRAIGTNTNSGQTTTNTQQGVSPAGGVVGGALTGMQIYDWLKQNGWL